MVVNTSLPLISTFKVDINSCIILLLACGGNFNSLNGSFSSPGYPHTNYPNNANCRYEIRVPHDRRIVLTFDFVDLDQQFDRILVKQLLAGSLSNVAVITGSTRTNRRFISAEHVFVIQLISDAVGTARGFTARYHTIKLGKLRPTFIYTQEGCIVHSSFG